MSGVSQAQKAAPPPLAQAIDGHRQQLDIVAVYQLVHAPAQERSDARDVFAKRRETFLPDYFEAPLRDHIGALPIVGAVKHHQNLPCAEAPQRLIRVTRLTRKTHPKHVDRSPQIDDLEPSFGANNGMPAICSQSQIRAHFENALRGLGANSRYAAI